MLEDSAQTSTGSLGYSMLGKATYGNAEGWRFQVSPKGNEADCPILPGSVPRVQGEGGCTHEEKRGDSTEEGA
jgi:hypothetical protein